MPFIAFATIILLSLTVIFYLAFFSLLYYWHEKAATYIVVPMLFTFEFFLVAFLIFGLVVLVVQYAPLLFHTS